MSKKAVVVLSGGQDSATCLAWACKEFDEVYAISFNYGQKHEVELKCAKKLSALAGVKEHKIVSVDSLNQVAVSSLIESQGGDVNQPHPMNPDLPSSFVPGRNLIFLTLAAAWGYGFGALNLVTGVCETDSSGYPDCRENTMISLGDTIELGFGIHRINIRTPLMYKTKAETVLMMKELGKLDWYKVTHTCYNGKQPPCMDCPACRLRAKGFEEAGIIDPLF